MRGHRTLLTYQKAAAAPAPGTPDFLATAPAQAGRLLEPALPGELRQLVRQEAGPIRSGVAPALATATAGRGTAGRPVTAHVPVYQPILDLIYQMRGRGRVSRGSTSIEMALPMRGALRGSAGMLETPVYSPQESSGRQATAAGADSQAPPQAPEGDLHPSSQAHTVRQYQARRAQTRIAQRSWEGTAHRVREASEQSPLLGTMSAAYTAPSTLSRTIERPAPVTARGAGTGEMAAQSVTETGSSARDGRGGGTSGGDSSGSDGEGRRSWGQSGAARTPTATSQTSAQPGAPGRQQRLASFRLAASHQAFQVTMQKLESQVTGRHTQTAIRYASYSIENILKKVYRDQELSQLDEREAINSLCLMLKLGGEFTYAHSARVLDLAMDLADEMGITDEETRRQIEYGALLKDIGEVGLLLDRESEEKQQKIAEFMSSEDMLRAGLLHDIGKLRIPPEILYKPGRMTDEEYEIMKMHPIYGEQIVYPIASLRHLCPTIRGHHERWDGKGYPDGLKGEGIPLPARVLAVVDVFDALAEERPYKRGMGPARARELLLEGKGSHFDPDVVEAFVRVLDRRYPEHRKVREPKPESVDA